MSDCKPQGLGNRNVLVGVTAGIAAYRSAELVRRLRERGARVRVMMTEGARAFITPLTMQAVSGHPARVKLLDSDAESGMDHIELARWADLVVVAPASADALARLAAGMADDLLTTVCLASEAPAVAAPAMNRVMWDKPTTRRNVQRLRDDGWLILGPGVGDQACGESGPGRMLEPERIVDALEERFTVAPPRDVSLKVMVTAGPTWEALDPVRGLTNASSGKMGYALADAFLERGAQVTLVSGPCALEPPPAASLVRVRSALEMFDAVQRDIGAQHVFVAVAAVADYRPKSRAEGKIKKHDDETTVTLVRNPDILAGVAALEDAPFCVGFAAETGDLRSRALHKLESKGLDLVAANLVGSGDGGFDADRNELLVLAEGFEERIGPASKSAVARRLCALILDRYAQKDSPEDR